MPSEYFKTEGLVMKKMPFGEADFLVRLLTKDFGKMDALAKGARKSVSKLNPHLDILNHIRLQFVKNGERIPTLTDAEIISKFDDWFVDADKLSIMGRVIQVLDMVLMPGSSDEKLFQIVLRFFSAERPKAIQADPPNREAVGGFPSEQEALHFLRDFFSHEGHGDSLPPEHREAIIRLWPVLRN